MGWPLHRDPDQLIRPGVAAKRLGVTAQTIRRWMAKGILPFVEVGPYHRKRLRLSDVEHYRHECST